MISCGVYEERAEGNLFIFPPKGNIHIDIIYPQVLERWREGGGEFNRKRLKMFDGIGKGDFLSVFGIRNQSGFKWVSGIRIREGKNDPQKRKKKKCRNLMLRSALA
jgi:hypothetical protein